MASLDQRLRDLTRKLAEDQIAQDIDFNGKLAAVQQNASRLLALESKVRELIAKCWVQESVAPLDESPQGGSLDFSERLLALETKVSELQKKAWVQEALVNKD